MTVLSGSARLMEFAEAFIRDIDHYKDVRTEALAEAFRESFGLPPFPRLRDFASLFPSIGIMLDTLPNNVAMPGMNAWHDESGPYVLLREHLERCHRETTIAHELREVLENAFKRAKPAYIGLDTHDNPRMNPKSDQFAGCLLMQTAASHAALALNGFDLVSFAAETGRSLPSVVVRLQTLYSASFAGPGPTGGVWLFDAPWDRVISGRATVDDMNATQLAHLRGFSLADVRGNEHARLVFPVRGHHAAQVSLVAEALASRGPVARAVNLSLFDEMSYVCVAEPRFAGDAPWRVLLTVIRRDGLELVGPWLRRLDLWPPFASAACL